MRPETEMARPLSDAEISDLLAQPKMAPAEYMRSLRPRPRLGMRHLSAEVDVRGAGGSDFRILVRQSDIEPTNFSVILLYALPGSNEWFRLRRNNGDHGTHGNRIEGTTARGFHIHVATERYQLRGMKPDSYAEETDRYSTLDAAIRCMMEDANIRAEETPGDEVQLRLIE